MSQVATLDEAYQMRAKLRVWHGFWRCQSADRRLPSLRRYEGVIMAEPALESLRDCEELIRRLRR